MAPIRSGTAMRKGTCPVATFPTRPAEEEKSPIARVLPSALSEVSSARIT